eukprot:CAMPEP_0184390532 /NCGR_PEP_ID=MMETSP0007-20130409/13384_1 /TAXON_ID=97485 /ORGANISM="Prymnesium parvum, Strain Texoma1" /LENGTH=103 /DNA_ID=CAMNT_0026740303 /DNA_START=297 /DNA_END=604 /DNA_ORIENTATION=-
MNGILPTSAPGLRVSLLHQLVQALLEHADTLVHFGEGVVQRHGGDAHDVRLARIRHDAMRRQQLLQVAHRGGVGRSVRRRQHAQADLAASLRLVRRRDLLHQR